MFKNTTQKAGDILEVTSNMKLVFNLRPVNVKISKADRALLDAVAEMYYCDTVYFQSPATKLQVEITSDTFRGGLTGKLVNLQQWHDERQAAYSAAWEGYLDTKADTWAAID